MRNFGLPWVVLWLVAGCASEPGTGETSADAVPSDGASGEEVVDGSGDADVAVPDADVAVPDADVAVPDADVAGPDGDVGVQDGDVGVQDADVAEGAGTLDEQLQFQHIQALGTHNSYHLEPLTSWIVGEWAYSHLPLEQQAEFQGVRQFELDLYYQAADGIFGVFHIPLVDKESTCVTFQECLSHLKVFSDAYPEHHPMVVMMEIKSELVTMDAASLLVDLEARALEVWPVERLIRPDDVRGDSANLRDAIAEKGWPSLGELRGRILLMLHTGGELRDVYTEGLTTTEGRVFFPDAYGDLSLPIAGIHSINGPIGGFDKIQTVVSAGHLVRTRGDADSEEAKAVDYMRFQAALDSGAHFISTDYPFPGDEFNYGVVIPGGNPSRCNPITAPIECSAEALEDL